MKKIWNIALALALVLTLCACGGGEDKGGSADFSVQTLMEEMLAAAPVSDPLTLGESDLLDYFGIKAEWMTEFAAVTCANGITAQEIILVKAVDEEKGGEVLQKLENRLNNRAAEAENYLPDQYAVITECSARQDGPYVALIIHPEHAALEEMYQEKLNG